VASVTAGTYPLDASEAGASEDATTDSGSAMLLQLNSRVVSRGAGGPASEQLATMITISSAAHNEASPRVVSRAWSASDASA
jgi:hypothetical protein